MINKKNYEITFKRLKNKGLRVIKTHKVTPFWSLTCKIKKETKTGRCSLCEKKTIVSTTDGSNTVHLNFCNDCLNKRKNWRKK